MDSFKSSKSQRLLNCLPSIRPSFLSVMLLFVCGCLWEKNETTNEQLIARLIALETRIKMPVEVLVKTGGSMEKSEGTKLKPRERTARPLSTKLQSPVDEVKFDYTPG